MLLWQALGYCLCRDVFTTTMLKDEVLEFMTNLTDLLINITEYMLSKLACASPNGSGMLLFLLFLDWYEILLNEI